MKTDAVTLTKDQVKANNAFLDFLVSNDNFFVIQGAAGTGKSFLIRHLLETFYARYSAYCLLLQKDVESFDIKITATTNKAVSVVGDFLEDLIAQKGDLEVRTIFSLLGLKVQNDRKTGKSSLTFNSKGGGTPAFASNKTPLIFIDEASFIGEDLHEIIKELLQNNASAKIVYIGDKYQLAPVGQTFSAMDSLECKKAVLDEIVRNKGHILATGTQFRESVETGVFKPIQYNNTDVIHADGPTFQAAVEDSFSDADWKPGKSKILAWTNERVQDYNGHIRKSLKRPDIFQVGETVVTNEFIHSPTYSRAVDSEVKITSVNPQEQTHYGVKGLMVEIDHNYVGFMPLDYQDAKAAMKKLAKDKEWRKYFEIKENWLDLRAVYASSVHKSQGSTYDTVFLDLTDIGKNWNADDAARLLYVSITRAAQKVVCYGYLPDKYC